MDAYIFKTGRHLTPWGDPVAKACVLNEPLEHSLPAALGAAGAQRVWTDVAREEFQPEPVEAVLATDDLWITPELAEAFVQQARELGKPAILALTTGLFTDFSAAVQRLGSAQHDGRDVLLYPLVWIPGGTRWKYPDDLTEAEGLAPVCVDLAVRPIDMPVHRIFSEDRKFSLPPDPPGVRARHALDARAARQPDRAAGLGIAPLHCHTHAACLGRAARDEHQPPQGDAEAGDQGARLRDPPQRRCGSVHAR